MAWEKNANYHLTVTLISQGYKLSIKLNVFIIFKTTSEKNNSDPIDPTLIYLNAFLKHNIQHVIHLNYEMWTLRTPDIFYSSSTIWHWS